MSQPFDRGKFSPDVHDQLKLVYGEDAEKAARALLTPGSRYYFRVNTLKASSEDTIRRLERRNITAGTHPTIPEALSVEVEGPCEVCEHKKRVVVEKYTAESVMQGANVYAMGIVDCRGIRRGDQVSVTHQKGGIVACGTARMNETEILTYRKGLAVEVHRSLYRVPSLRETEEFAEGLVYPQTLPAMVATRVLNPKPTETIVDLTCAPGGKLSHITQLMRNEGKAIGIDRNKRKAQRTLETLRRLGCRNATVAIQDARYIDQDFPSLKADAVLIDPPCSALGTMPKIYDHTTEQTVKRLSTYQKQFLKAAKSILLPTGRIVFSVCTVTLAECEENVRFAESIGLRVEEQSLIVGSPGLSRILPEAALCQRFHPHVHNAGFFIASFSASGVA